MTRYLFLAMIVVAMMSLIIGGCQVAGEQSSNHKPVDDTTTDGGRSPLNVAAFGVQLEPVDGSGTHGSVEFRENEAGGIEVKLDLYDLPEPQAVYVGAIYEGFCPDEAGSVPDRKRERAGKGRLFGKPVFVYASSDLAHGGHEAPADEENLLQPLTSVSSDPDGSGSSITPLPSASAGILTGSPKYVDVHGPDSSIVSCGNLTRREA